MKEKFKPTQKENEQYNKATHTHFQLHELFTHANIVPYIYPHPQLPSPSNYSEIKSIDIILFQM